MLRCVKIFLSCRKEGKRIKRLNNLAEERFLRHFFLFFSGSFLVAAFFMPDRADMFRGLWEICSSPTLASTSFFSLGGYAATFLNMGLVGLIATALFHIHGPERENHNATLITILTTGFGAWGIHVMNIWPGMLGVLLHCYVKKERVGDHSNAMLFTSGLAPFYSELMIRYPHADVVGFRPEGIVLAVLVGLAAGFFLPAGLDNSPKVHKGFDIYSAALPVGMTAFLIQGFLYRAMGVEVPQAVSDLTVVSPAIVDAFCITLFSLCIVIAVAMGCRLEHYVELLIDPELVTHFTRRYGNAVFVMNVGVYGLFILAYYHLIGAPFNGVTFGVIFCMLATCNAGSHPANVLPIMIGYALASTFFRFASPFFGGEFDQYLHTQSIIVGLCYANGLSPISDKYGWFYGTVAAMMHYCMVTTVPELHGGMCLYDGGFTAAFVCLLMIPGLQRHFTPKLERRQLRKLSKAKFE